MRTFAWPLIATIIALAPPAAFAGPTSPPGEPVGWGRESARELLRRSKREQAAGRLAEALYLATESIRVDGTFGAAWLQVASLRVGMRDYAEAERVYERATRIRSVAPEALAARATLRRRLGHVDAGLADLERSVALDPSALEHWRLLASWYAERRAWPAALAAWRRVLQSLAEAPQTDAYRTARIQVAALTQLTAEADPVSAPPEGADWVRRSLARVQSE